MRVKILLLCLLLCLTKHHNFYAQEGIPGYWLSASGNGNGYLDQRISDIPKGKSFIFFSDSHWVKNAKHSIDIIEYVRSKTNIRTVVFGGDALTEDKTHEEGLTHLRDFADKCYSTFGDDFIFCVGNHDSNYFAAKVSNEGYVTDKEIFEYAIERESKNLHFDNSIVSDSLLGRCYDNPVDYDYWRKQYYYADIQKLKIRFIITETGNEGLFYRTCVKKHKELKERQWNFVKRAIGSVPKGYDIVIVGHDVTDISKDSSRGWQISPSKRNDYVLAPYTKQWCQWLKHKEANNKNIHSLILGGHIHIDQNFKYKDINVSTILSDCTLRGHIINDYKSKQAVGKGKTGTISEQCFDVVTFTKTGIAFTRFGAGEDRFLTY